MQRKLIKQGTDSYTVTLPRAWVKENGLSSGDLLDFTEADGALVVLPKARTPKPRVITIDVKGRSHRDILNALNQSYRKGFDHVTLAFSRKEELSEIKRVVKTTMLGFEVTIESKGTCTVENIAEPAPDKFETIFKKLFYLIKSEATEIIDDLRSARYNTELRLQQKQSIDLYTNYLRRTLICHRIDTKANSHLLYQIIGLLSGAHHSYYYLHQRVGKPGQRDKLSKKITDELHSTVELLSLLFDSLFKKNLDSAFKIQTLKQEYSDHFFAVQGPTFSGINVIGLYHVSEIVRHIQIAGTLAIGYLFSPPNE